MGSSSSKQRPSTAGTIHTMRQKNAVPNTPPYQSLHRNTSPTIYSVRPRRNASINSAIHFDRRFNDSGAFRNGESATTTAVGASTCQTLHDASFVCNLPTFGDVDSMDAMLTVPSTADRSKRRWSSTSPNPLLLEDIAMEHFSLSEQTPSFHELRVQNSHTPAEHRRCMGSSTSSAATAQATRRSNSVLSEGIGNGDSHAPGSGHNYGFPRSTNSSVACAENSRTLRHAKAVLRKHLPQSLASSYGSVARFNLSESDIAPGARSNPLLAQNTPSRGPSAGDRGMHAAAHHTRETGRKGVKRNVSPPPSPHGRPKVDETTTPTKIYMGNSTTMKQLDSSPSSPRVESKTSIHSQVSRHDVSEKSKMSRVLRRASSVLLNTPIPDELTAIDSAKNTPQVTCGAKKVEVFSGVPENHSTCGVDCSIASDNSEDERKESLLLLQARREAVARRASSSQPQENGLLPFNPLNSDDTPRQHTNNSNNSDTDGHPPTVSWMAIGSEEGIGTMDWYARLRQRCEMEEMQENTKENGHNKTLLGSATEVNEEMNDGRSDARAEMARTYVAANAAFSGS